MCGASTPYVLGVRTICAEHERASKRQKLYPAVGWSCTQQLGSLLPSGWVQEDLLVGYKSTQLLGMLSGFFVECDKFIPLQRILSCFISRQNQKQCRLRKSSY